MKHTPPPLDLPASAVLSIRKTEKLSDGVTAVSGTEGMSQILEEESKGVRDLAALSVLSLFNVSIFVLCLSTCLCLYAGHVLPFYIYIYIYIYILQLDRDTIHKIQTQNI